MAAIKHIFLDDGDVINDNRVRGPQWQQLAGEFFVPRLGGTREAWAKANHATANEINERLFRRFEAKEGTYAQLYHDFEVDWLQSMARFVGVDVPANEDDCFALAHDASAYITRRVKAAFPGAAESIRELGERFVLRTASNEHSCDIEGYLEGMGVANLFRGFYGADLLNANKHQAAFYPRLFADADVDPTEALVVDDKLEFVRAAAAIGARVVRVNEAGIFEEGFPTIRSLSELPALLRDGLLE
jgi:HAD superfamily hydrolase (TIGR01509 family)